MQSAKARAWLWVAVYAACIFVASSQPMPPEPPPYFNFEGADKVAHAFLYLGLGMLFFRARTLGTNRWAMAGTLLETAAFCLLYGMTDEAHQHFVPTRNVEAMDLLADAVGGLAGGTLQRWIAAKRYGDNLR